MKKLLLSALFIGSFGAAQAQMMGGIGVSPLGATAGDEITIYAQPSLMCGGNNPAPGANPPSLRMHGGVTVAGAAWQSVVSASPLPAAGGDGMDYSVVGFQGSGDWWWKTIVPATYWGVAATDIEGMNFVINAGPDDGNRWAAEGKFDNQAGGTCDDFYVPFPVAAGTYGFTGTKSQLNSSFKLHAPYPNPFNGETSIRFELKKAGNVNVRIVNLLGETVTTLASGYMTSGQKSMTWNADNAPAGIYFYTVETAGVTASEKMQVIK